MIEGHLCSLACKQITKICNYVLTYNSACDIMLLRLNANSYYHKEVSMDRDYGKEIDGINTQLDEIKKLLTEFTAKPRVPEFPAWPRMPRPSRPRWVHHPHKPKWHDNADKRLVELDEENSKIAADKGHSGFVTYLGNYSSESFGSYWATRYVSTDDLLDLIESNAAAKVLACIGNNDRLNMLLALLRAPGRTAAQLVEECGYNTTGQVYHHLKPLLTADLVTEDKHRRGCYMVQPHRVQGIIMLLAGISDMLNTKHSQGNWEPEEDTPE